MTIVPPRPSRPAPLLVPGLFLPLALAVSACGGGDKVESREGATGEILPGSASDAMVPVDQVRSQAPLAPHAGASDQPRAGGAGGNAAAAPAGPASEAAAPEPAAAPAPGATPDAG